MEDIKIGDRLEVIEDGFLNGNDVKPPLTNGQIHIAQDTYKCGCEELHIDIGIPSEYNYITCYKCHEDLPHSDTTHWCHSSRFKIV